MSNTEYLLNALKTGEDVSGFIPQSRQEEILKRICLKESLDDLTPLSRVEILFIEAAENITSGGGGGEVKVTARGSTPVPEGEFVEKLYFNTDMSVDDVVNFLKPHWFDDYPTIFGYYDDYFDVVYTISYFEFMPDEIYFIQKYAYTYDENIDDWIESYQLIFISRELNEDEKENFYSNTGFIPEFVGWNPELVNPVEINLENNNGHNPFDVSQLVSTTPFIRQVSLNGEYNGSTIKIAETKEIDVESLLNEKKLPLTFELETVVNDITIDTREHDISKIATSETVLPKARMSMNASVVGTKVYLFGGSDEQINQTDTITIYDTKTDKIVTSPTVLPYVLEYAAVSSIGTKIYLFGGTSKMVGVVNTIHIYDTETDEIVTSPTVLPRNLYSVSATSIGTKIYLFGGFNNGSVNTIYIYDTETDTITTSSTTLPTAYSGIVAVAVGTKVYLFGRYEADGVRRIDVYDTETDTITTSATLMPTEIASGFAAAAVGNKVYLFGGCSSGAYPYYDIIYIYDTETEAFTTSLVTLPSQAYGLSAATVGNKVYLFGGRGDNNDRRLDAIHIVEFGPACRAVIEGVDKFKCENVTINNKKYNIIVS